MLSKRIALLGALAAIACALTASTATASPSLMKGIYDDANLLTGNPDQNYAILGDLRTKVVLRCVLLRGAGTRLSPRCIGAVDYRQRTFVVWHTVRS